jgi:hypothetical protein
MRWFRKSIVHLRAIVAVWRVPERLTAEQRQRAIALIKRFAELDGLDTSISERYLFSSEILDKIPRQRGVYRIYEGTELKYIGASSRNIQRRLKRHWSASLDVDRAKNKGLASLIASGQADVEWYVCAFAGWMEEYELIEYCSEHGQQPYLNRHQRSNLLKRCLG